MTEDATWTAAASAILGWRRPLVEPLGGSDLRNQVARVRADGESAVLKHYGPEAFSVARLVAGLPDAPFAPVLGESQSHRVLAFADLGSTSLLDTIPDDVSGRRAAAVQYIAAVACAVNAMSALGPPPPVRPDASITGFLGFGALTRSARRLHTPSSQLLAIAALTRDTRPPRELVTAARAEDRALADDLAAVAGRRRWILQDSNPSNLLVPGNGAMTWVDVLPVAGLPETNLLTLGGTHFRLDDEAAGALAAAAGWTGLDLTLFGLLNGLFSVFTLCDTCTGLADGSRDGLIHSELSYRQAEEFSLELATRQLPGRSGYRPLLDWLLATPGRPVPRSRR